MRGDNTLFDGYENVQLEYRYRHSSRTNHRFSFLLRSLCTYAASSITFNGNFHYIIACEIEGNLTTRKTITMYNFIH